jgi:hypothetical protein
VGSHLWYWSAGPRYNHRDPSDPAEPTRDTLGAYGRVERRLGSAVALSLAGRWVEETVDSPDVSDRSVMSAEFGVLWYPRGRRGGSG